MCDKPIVSDEELTGWEGHMRELCISCRALAETCQRLDLFIENAQNAATWIDPQQWRLAFAGAKVLADEQSLERFGRDWKGEDLIRAILRIGIQKVSQIANETFDNAVIAERLGRWQKIISDSFLAEIHLFAKPERCRLAMNLLRAAQVLKDEKMLVQLSQILYPENPFKKACFVERYINWPKYYNGGAT